MRRLLITTFAGAALVACSPKPAANNTTAAATGPAAELSTAGEPVVPGTPGTTEAPAGVYKLDKTHSTLVLRVSHLGYSKYRMQFTDLDGELTFDPLQPATMKVTATVDPKSLQLPAPPAGFKQSLLGKDWLDADTYPQITFRSTKVELTSPTSADVTGDLTLHGVTKPIVLKLRFNGGNPPNAMDGARIGFSGNGAFKRSDFGIAYGLPAPGTNLGVGDRVDFTIETEWTSGQPAGPAPAP